MDWLIVILMGILSLYLLSGRGAMLIAGYNTATREERLRYDEKKLCRATGFYMGILTVLVGAGMQWGGHYPGIPEKIFPWVFVSCTVIFLLYVNLGGCSRSPEEVERQRLFLEQHDGCQRDNLRKEAQRESLSVLCVLMAVGILAFGVLMCFAGNVTLTLGERELICDADFVRELRIGYNDIRSAELSDTLETGDKVNGINSFRLMAGKFQNRKLGEYYRYTYTDSDQYILLKTGKGFLVISLENEEDTRSFFLQLNGRMDGEILPEVM